MMWQHVPPFFLAWAIGCKDFDPDSNMRRPVKVFNDYYLWSEEWRHLSEGGAFLFTQVFAESFQEIFLPLKVNIRSQGSKR